jgi:hypothetical protein
MLMTWGPGLISTTCFSVSRYPTLLPRLSTCISATATATSVVHPASARISCTYTHTCACATRAKDLGPSLCHQPKEMELCRRARVSRNHRGARLEHTAWEQYPHQSPCMDMVCTEAQRTTLQRAWLWLPRRMSRQCSISSRFVAYRFFF